MVIFNVALDWAIPLLYRVTPPPLMTREMSVLGWFGSALYISIRLCGYFP